MHYVLALSHSNLFICVDNQKDDTTPEEDHQHQLRQSAAQSSNAANGDENVRHVVDDAFIVTDDIEVGGEGGGVPPPEQPVEPSPDSPKVEARSMQTATCCGKSITPFALKCSAFLVLLAVTTVIVAPIAVHFSNQNRNKSAHPVGGEGGGGGTSELGVNGRPTNEIPPQDGGIVLEDSVRKQLITDLITTLSTEEVLNDPETPQGKAFAWMLSHGEGVDAHLTSTLPEMPLRLSERYALAVLYYALRGDEWNEKGAFLSGQPQCYWSDVMFDCKLGFVTGLYLGE